MTEPIAGLKRTVRHFTNDFIDCGKCATNECDCPADDEDAPSS